MKLFEKIRRFIRGADRAVTNAICERLDNTAEKLENFARNLDPEAFQATKLAAQADRIMHDLYDEVSSYTTPVEDYLEGQFEDAEADPEAEAEEEQEDAE